MIALIMAGGIGSRFWPLSRKNNPKQFLNILSEKSMLQMTVDRLTSKIDLKDIFIVTSNEQVELTKLHLPELPEENVIIEPFGMNTAPCIALSALYLSRSYDKNTRMIVLPADHLIIDKNDFLQSLDAGDEIASQDNLVTFGIKPNFPATGYGYIEAGEKIERDMFYVKQFKEKPDYQTAQKFLQKGNFFWNSGMFLWKIETILNAFKNYLPKVYGLLQQIETNWQESGISADITNVYRKMPRLPVDIGIMEQAEKRVVIPVDYGWNDVGSWKALYEISPKDRNQNVINCDNITLDSKKNYVHSDKFVALIGIEDTIIVETSDALLITKKEKAENVKKIVEKLQSCEKNSLI